LPVERGEIAEGADSGPFPPGLLRYAWPRGAGERRGLMPYLAVGAVLIASDRQAIRAFGAGPLMEPEAAAREGEESDGAGAARAAAHPWRPDPIYRDLSRIGDAKTLGLTLVVVYGLGGERGRDAARVGAVALVNASALTTLVKALTGKVRPDASGGRVRYLGPSTRYLSFPSGHTSAATSVAVVLAHYFPSARWLWYALAGGAGVGRIGLGRHWPSDVWWGAGVGIVSAEGALQRRARLLSWQFSF
jgi:undecaprenyl-diphosphatase